MTEYPAGCLDDKNTAPKTFATGTVKLKWRTHAQVEQPVLLSHGWDALVYKNAFEDAGSQSWINLTAAQVQIVQTEDIEASPINFRAQSVEEGIELTKAILLP
jgi:hypothetical protein